MTVADTLASMIKSTISAVKWRLGMNVPAPEVSLGRESFIEFYDSRLTDCSFLNSPEHYEWPRAEWVIEKVGDHNVLELGCGNGGMTMLLAKKARRVTAVDVSTPSIKAVDELGLPNVTTRRALVEDLPINGGYDIVVLSEVIEHVPEPAKVLQVAFRHLKPGGRLLITTPRGHWENHEHIHEFTFTSFAGLIMSALDAEAVDVGYLRDRDNRRRWLVASCRAASPADPDDFFDRRATRRRRRPGRHD